MAAAKKTHTAAKKSTSGAAHTDSGAGAELEQLPETRTYCVGDCPVLHDGEYYRPGHDLELTDDQAKRLGNKVSLITAALPGEPTTAE